MLMKVTKEREGEREKSSVGLKERKGNSSLRGFSL